MVQDGKIARKLKSLVRRADSECWTERESAGFELRNLMEANFDEVYRLTRSWVSHRSPRVRRAACLACMQRKAITTPPRLKKVLSRLARLMKDGDIYVRKCCGPFVVGYLGYTYPTSTLPWLRQIAASEDVNVRANVAKAFSQALGKHSPEAGLEILNELASDDRARVKSAVSASLRNIMKRNGIKQMDVSKKFGNLHFLLQIDNRSPRKTALHAS